MRRFLLAASFFLAIASPAAASSSLETGMADDRALNADPSVAQAWAAAGVDMVRIHARWRAIAPDPGAKVPPAGFHFSDPDSPGYDWAALDQAVAAVRSAGMKVTLAVTGPGPVWASADPSRGDGRYKP